MSVSKLARWDAALRGNGWRAWTMSSGGLTMAAYALTGSALAGCVQVAAPDKPIVIELNINIKQEVVYRLDGEAQQLIKSEAEIF